jgi:uncharacterized membrane protein YphA (DoxX/SURF4 family)
VRPRFQFGLATVLMLVLLRLNIGWHFFSEGAKHYTDPNWSSEAFLRAAKGPLAPRFQSVLPEYHRWDQLMHGEGMDADDAKQWHTDSVKWSTALADGWELVGRKIGNHYGYSKEQKTQVDEVLQRGQQQLATWLAENEEALRVHALEWRRLEAWRESPTASDLPFQRKRIGEKQAALTAESSAWLNQIKAVEQKLRDELLDLRDKAPGDREPRPQETSSLRTVDTVMTYGILAIGVCLMTGLFTRLAALLGALFLLSVVLTQPFWVTDTQPTFNQLVEMFALLALATTHVGRWGGLDFFVHNLLVRPFWSAKGDSNALDT